LFSLTFHDFRNLSDSTWSPPPGRVLLLGDNGSGKTSLLEALYVAATTKSFRAAQIQECRRHGATQFDVQCVSGRDRIGVGVDSAGARFRHVNGKETSLAEHLAVMPLVAWTTSERDLFTGPPADRRRFVDRGLIAEKPASLVAMQRYGQALAQKRALLQKARAGIESWNELLAQTGGEVVRLRAAHIAQLAVALEGVLTRAQFPFPAIAVRYRPSPSRALEGVDALRAQLEASVDEERRRRQPLVGPHRDELVVTWEGSELRQRASAGERKALGMALLIAQVEVLEGAGRSPSLILDDADTELDHRALGRVWSLVGERSVFASSNRADVWQGLALESRFELREGAILEA
jgi:DNA replication and repair protein RecF